MKTIKPQKLGVLTRTMEADRRSFLIVSIFLFVPLDRPRNVLTEVEMWKTLGPELGAGALDDGWSKARGEVLVTGRCFAPGGARRPASYVRVKLGTLDKRLAVVGDRFWKDGVPTQPVPFVEMPVDHARAFGGAGFEENPAGKGAAPLKTTAGELLPLPNVELPDRLVTSPKHRPPPALLDAIPIDWPQRRAKAGTYDQEWLATWAPGLPKDADPSLFNAAPADQQLAAGVYLRGDEPFVIENMHATRPWIEGRLPGLVTRAFVTQRRGGGDEVFRELSTRLDTVRFFPHVERAVLVYRGLLEIAEDDAADVLHLVAACEDPGAPKRVEHYREVLAQRLDRKRGALRGLRDTDLMPAASGDLVPVASKDERGRLLEGEDLLRKNMRRRKEAEVAAAAAKLEAQGIDPAKHGVGPLPPEEAPPGIEDPDALVAFLEAQIAKADEQRAAAEAKRAEQIEALRALCKKEGLDFEAITAKADAGGPPRFSAEQRIAALPPEVLRASPTLPESLRQTEARVHEAYRVMAHEQSPPHVLDPAARAARGAALVAAAANHERVAGRDFTGADLAGKDLRGASLRGVFLEGADLSGADLSGADLTGAVLARAELAGARLVSATLVGANLGKSEAPGADLSGADLTGAVLAGARLEGAVLRDATMNKANLMETALGGADLGGASATALNAMKTDLTGAKLAAAKLDRCVFLEAKLAGADFSGAETTRVAFVTCEGEGAVFRRAKLDRTAFVERCSFPRADFREARLSSGNLRGTKLDRATFERARVDGADLSECSLQGADLSRAVAPSVLMIRADLTDARLVGANLMNAILQKAKIAGADLSGANLFRADLTQARGDRRTKLDGAHVKQARAPQRSGGGPG